MNRPTTAILSLTLTILLSAAVVQAKPKGATPPKDDATKKDPSTVGTVVKIDGTNIVVQTRGKNAAEVVIPTDTRTEFQINAAAALLADIKPGMEIVATPNTGTAKKVMVNDDTKDKKAKKDKKKKAAK